MIDKGILTGTMYDAVPKTFDYDKNIVIVRTDIQFHPFNISELDEVEEEDNEPFEDMSLYSYHEYEFSIKEYYDNEKELKTYINSFYLSSEK